MSPLTLLFGCLLNSPLRLPVCFARAPNDKQDPISNLNTQNCEFWLLKAFSEDPRHPSARVTNTKHSLQLGDERWFSSGFETCGNWTPLHKDRLPPLFCQNLQLAFVISGSQSYFYHEPELETPIYLIHFTNDMVSFLFQIFVLLHIVHSKIETNSQNTFSVRAFSNVYMHSNDFIVTQWGKTRVLAAMWTLSTSFLTFINILCGRSDAQRRRVCLFDSVVKSQDEYSLKQSVCVCVCHAESLYRDKSKVCRNKWAVSSDWTHTDTQSRLSLSLLFFQFINESFKHSLLNHILNILRNTEQTPKCLRSTEVLYPSRDEYAL